jgi:hypothetical protein
MPESCAGSMTQSIWQHRQAAIGLVRKLRRREDRRNYGSKEAAFEAAAVAAALAVRDGTAIQINVPGGPESRGSVARAGYHENRKTPISKPPANAQRPNVQAETTRTRIRRSGFSWDRSVIAAAPPSIRLASPYGPRPLIIFPNVEIMATK